MQRHAHSMVELHEQAPEKKSRHKKKERKTESTPPPKPRPARSTSEIEVLSDAAVDHEARTQVYVYDPKERALKKEKDAPSDAQP